MAGVRARYPRLMIPDDPPRILGHECRACGRRAFPPDPYGCERCGATVDELAPIELVAAGTIHALATVHRHHHDRPETPFTVASIVLDDGITLKGVLAGDRSDARQRAGRRSPSTPLGRAAGTAPPRNTGRRRPSRSWCSRPTLTRPGR